MAAQCEQREGFHVDPFYGYVELLEHPSGYLEIVATSLLNDAMPFIRYRTGDLVEGWIEAPCACGRWHRRIGYILGRTDDVITNTSGQPVLPVQIRTDLGHTFSDMPPYTIVQHAHVGSYTLRLYTDDSKAARNADVVVDRLRQWLGEDADIAVQFMDAGKLHSVAGKHKIVVREPA